jgi:hypothetical protein
MKIKTKITVLLIVTVLVSCSPLVATPPRADNFALVFQDFSCGSIPMYVLDTTSGTLVYTPLGDTTSITISLELSDDERESVYQKAMSIGFFEYPSEFVVPDDQVLGYQAPSSSYQLSMTNSEMTNSVTWRDDTMTKSGYKKADELRELMNLINEIIQSHPEVQQLPGPKVLCL